MAVNDRVAAEERRRSVVIAGHVGPPEAARAGLADPDPDTRSAALGALERLGALTTHELQRGLADPDPRTRRRAALIAAGRDDSLAQLEQLLEDPDPLVVEAASFACGERSDATSGTVLGLCGLATSHEDSLCREAAVAAMGSIGSAGSMRPADESAALAAILTACTDRATVRRRAVLALAAFDGPEVTDMLTRMTGDRDLQVRQAAEELLAIEQGEDL